MAIFKRGKVWYVDHYVEGKRRRVSLGEGTKERAEIRLGELRRRNLDGFESFEETKKIPLSILVESYLKELTRRGRAEKHVEITGVRIRALLVGFSRVDELTPDRIRGSLHRLSAAANLSPKTTNDYRSCLSGLFTWLVKENRWPRNPCAAVARVRQTGPLRERRALSLEELGRLVGSSPTIRAAVYDLAACAGLRRGELKALRWTSVDLAAGVVTVTAKTAKNRRAAVLEIPPGTVARLAALRGTAPSDALVFPSIPLTRTFYKDLTRAGIVRQTVEGVVDLHALRTSTATNLAATGAPLALAQKMMRHSTPALTSNVYTKLGNAASREAVARIEVRGKCVTKVCPTPQTSTDKQRLTRRFERPRKRQAPRGKPRGAWGLRRLPD